MGSEINLLSSYLPVRNEMHIRNNSYIWTAVIDESEEWSSQYIFQFKQLERRSLKKKNGGKKNQGFNGIRTRDLRDIGAMLWNCTRRSGSCNFSFLKNSQVQINFKIEREKPYDYLVIIPTWKNSRRKIAGRCWSHFIRIRDNVFQSFRTKFLSLLYMISLDYKISHCLSANHYPELRCVKKT